MHTYSLRRRVGSTTFVLALAAATAISVGSTSVVA